MTTRDTYQKCLLDAVLPGLAASEPEAAEGLYNVAYFDKEGSLWTDTTVLATSPEHAWQKVQAEHADAFTLHAATTAETE